MKKPITLILTMLMFVGSVAAGIRPVFAEGEDNPGDEIRNAEEITEEPENTEVPEEEEEPEPTLNEEILSWMLRYELGGYFGFPDNDHEGSGGMVSGCQPHTHIREQC